MCLPAPFGLDLVAATARLETGFGILAARAVTLVAGELDDTNGEAIPMSPWNHAQVLA
jgi:hypothetical protein